MVQRVLHPELLAFGTDTDRKAVTSLDLGKKSNFAAVVSIPGSARVNVGYSHMVSQLFLIFFRLASQDRTLIITRKQQQTGRNGERFLIRNGT